MQEVILGNKKISDYHPPFIIAEMSANHNQSLERALKMVEAAANSGAHALKLQTYTAETMTLNISHGDFYINESNNLWQGNSLYELYQKAYTPWEWHKPIFKRCKELGIIPFSTPFDESAVDFLEDLDVPFYKIASFENNHIPLIKKVASTGKPIIISTGLATIGEIDEAVKVIQYSGSKDIVLMKCTSSYPASETDTNLLTIPHMKELFNCQVGLSDHTLGTGVAIASVAMGATVIEKHFTLSRKDGGVDSAFSLEEEEFKSLVIEVERAYRALGKVHYGPTEKENGSLKFRRSIYAAEDIKAGELFTKNNLKIIRPSFGLEPKNYDQIIGRKSKQDIPKGTPIKWKFIL